MSDLVVLALKLGFIALLWLFILFTGNVIRTDLFGRKVSAAELAPPAPPGAPAPPKLSRRQAKKLPKSLVVTHGRQAGLTLPLGDVLLIGRSPDCQLVLDDDYVSTRHAQITRTASGYQVEDLGSTNGSWLGDHRVGEPEPMDLGVQLKIGQTVIELRS